VTKSKDTVAAMTKSHESILAYLGGGFSLLSCWGGDGHGVWVLRTLDTARTKATRAATMESLARTTPINAATPPVIAARVHTPHLEP